MPQRNRLKMKLPLFYIHHDSQIACWCVKNLLILCSCVVLRAREHLCIMNFPFIYNISLFLSAFRICNDSRSLFYGISSSQPDRQIFSTRWYTHNHSGRLHIWLCTKQNHMRKRIPYADPCWSAQLSNNCRFYGCYCEKVSTLFVLATFFCPLDF